MHIHKPAEHSQNKDKYAILIMRRTLTEWDQNAKITECVIPSWKNIHNILRRPLADGQDSSFIPTQVF